MECNLLAAHYAWKGQFMVVLCSQTLYLTADPRKESGFIQYFNLSPLQKNIAVQSDCLACIVISSIPYL